MKRKALKLFLEGFENLKFHVCSKEFSTHWHLLEVYYHLCSTLTLQIEHFSQTSPHAENVFFESTTIFVLYTYMLYCWIWALFAIYIGSKGCVSDIGAMWKEGEGSQGPESWRLCFKGSCLSYHSSTALVSGAMESGATLRTDAQDSMWPQNF